MRRISVVRPFLLRHLVCDWSSSSSSIRSFKACLLSSPPIPPPAILTKLYSNSTTNLRFSHHFFHCRTFSSPSGPSKIVPITSEEELNSSLSKVQDESLPAIFYFTAVWCGPCRFISPIIAELSEKYPHVTTYKIDIDQDGLGSTLNKLNITSVPTLHFFKNGKKVSEVIGADVTRLKDNVERLYKQQHD